MPISNCVGLKAVLSNSDHDYEDDDDVFVKIGILSKQRRAQHSYCDDYEDKQRSKQWNENHRNRPNRIRHLTTALSKTHSTTP